MFWNFYKWRTEPWPTRICYTPKIIVGWLECSRFINAASHKRKRESRVLFFISKFSIYVAGVLPTRILLSDICKKSTNWQMSPSGKSWTESREMWGGMEGLKNFLKIFTQGGRKVWRILCSRRAKRFAKFYRRIRMSWPKTRKIRNSPSTDAMERFFSMEKGYKTTDYSISCIPFIGKIYWSKVSFYPTDGY